MEQLFEDFVIKLFNKDNELVGMIHALGFPEEEQIKSALKLHRSDDPKLNAVYATIDKRFTVDTLPFSE